MLCAIYKSSKKQETYLYVLKRDDFSAVPEALLTTFGTPQFVTLLNLANRAKLALADIEKVKAGMQQYGFYLQLPPPTEDLLKTHRASNGSDDLTE
ncbi:hypothetical protein A9Q98_06810 [Thalassotalea sp. 42_200_T64]|nr:hypothetical protein A9Q98_06810 [Thalassotalea sp. 42_200_T64]